jgi:hypothetical protein
MTLAMTRRDAKEFRWPAPPSQPRSAPQPVRREAPDVAPPVEPSVVPRADSEQFWRVLPLVREMFLQGETAQPRELESRVPNSLSPSSPLRSHAVAQRELQLPGLPPRFYLPTAGSPVPRWPWPRHDEKLPRPALADLPAPLPFALVEKQERDSASPGARCALLSLG